MVIKILGGGCSRCKALEEATRNAINELNINATIEKVQDYADIMSYGVMQTPALVIDEKVVLSGKVPEIKELKELIGNL
ncbi:MAG: TM0996/MTH895 family glutaredoxin-like protein [Bacteroidales bacterium]|nr:TM0996/MTH895 family glutaredoxin-like protein [Bacteroidales bacterium]HPD95021.1 thioredoxin family protein [Tenuifilaceae bacterium]HRX32328.1 thioredoxin family protein [Tenuifilaceae bacterium]